MNDDENDEQKQDVPNLVRKIEAWMDQTEIVGRPDGDAAVPLLCAALPVLRALLDPGDVSQMSDTDIERSRASGDVSAIYNDLLQLLPDIHPEQPWNAHLVASRRGR